mmetsp:Transcript_6020/g.20586  ORF Transcript_6020/g.20586 Transcript_6020/m.20586 type:complete len:249 (-) Transcript_6020:1088-1834(-)
METNIFVWNRQHTTATTSPAARPPAPAPAILRPSAHEPRPRRLPLALAGGALYDVVDAQDHLGGLGGREEHLLLHAEALVDPERLHVAHCTRDDVHTGAARGVGVRGAQAAHEVRAVQARVVRDDGRDLAQGARVRLHGEGLLARGGGGRLVDDPAHLHLRVPAPVHHAVVPHRALQHAEGVVQRALRLLQQVGGGPAQHDGAGLALLHAREVDELVLPDHDLLDQLARAQLDVLRPVERARDVPAQD